MSPSLNAFPHLCLLAIFQCLPLQSLLRTIRLVSTSWSSLLPTELNRRRSLVIVDDRTFDLSRLQLDQHRSRLIEHVRRDDDALTSWARLPHIDHGNVINRNNRYQNDLQLHNQISPQIYSLPRITKLTVMQQFIDLSALEQVTRLIDHWSNDLVTLKVSLKQVSVYWMESINPTNYDERMNEQIFKLFISINRVASLKHLKLELDFVRKEQITNLPPLTILSQLSTFHSGHLFKAHLDNTLLNNASCNRQLKISNCVQYKLDLLLQIDQEFCDKFVDVAVKDMLTVVDDDNGHLVRVLRTLNHFCTQFTSLTHLLLNIGNISIRMLAQHLPHLTQLVHLSLCVFDHLGFDDENPEDENIMYVPSVRLITLQLHIKSHNSTERLLLSEIFPNLQVLSINDYNGRCSVCHLETVDGFDQYARKQRQCAKLARRPFRLCANLHTIEINANDSLFCWHE